MVLHSCVSHKNVFSAKINFFSLFSGTGSNDVLKEVDLTIQPDHVCNSTLTGSINPDTMICVKNERGFQDVCHVSIKTLTHSTL